MMEEFYDELVRMKGEVVKFMESIDFVETGIPQIDEAIDFMYTACDEAVSEFDSVIELMTKDGE